VGGQRHAAAALPPGKTRYPLYKRLGGLQGQSVQAQKFSPRPGFQPQTVRPVASRYTDRTIPGQSQSLRCAMLCLLLGSIRPMSCALVWNRTLYCTWHFVLPALQQQHYYRFAGPRTFANRHCYREHNLEPNIRGDVTDQAHSKRKHDRTIELCTSPALCNLQVSQ
jgi:hypothetical protein